MGAWFKSSRIGPGSQHLHPIVYGGYWANIYRVHLIVYGGYWANRPHKGIEESQDMRITTYHIEWYRGIPSHAYTKGYLLAGSDGIQQRNPPKIKLNCIYFNPLFFAAYTKDAYWLAVTAHTRGCWPLLMQGILGRYI